MTERDGTRAALPDATFRSLHAEPKALPTAWLYDGLGSRLYDEITRLPEYYLPLREREILHARAAEIARLTRPGTLAELGAGTAKNIRLLLDALDAAGTLERFVPLDLSEETLRASAQAIAAAYPRISVQPIVGDFERDLDLLPGGDRRLVAFLGSTIGNLYPEQRGRLLTALAVLLAPDDALLLGLDLVKDVARLEAAYNDSRGVTEAFVRNALIAVNRELDTTFDQRAFAYRARWDPENRWMDIGFRARRAHTVSIPRLETDVAFDEDEPLRIEISSKFRREQFELEAGRAGLRVESWWTDRAGDFAVALVAPERKETVMSAGGPICSHLDQIEVTALPDKIDGCEECLKIGGTWVHLRMCMTCGKIGCCDSSPNKHATAHGRESGHPIIRSAEPGEDWSWCYLDEVAFTLTPP